MSGDDVRNLLILGGITIIYLKGSKRDEAEIFAILSTAVIVFHTFVPVGKHMIWYALVQNIKIIGS